MVQIVVKGADFSANAVDYISPVPDGLEYLNYFGGLDKSLSRNLVKGKPLGVVVGAPTLGPNSATFTPLTSYIQTAVVDTKSKTLFAVARSPVIKGEGLLISNYNSQRQGSGTITPATSLLYRAAGDPDAGQTSEMIMASTWDGTSAVQPTGPNLVNRPLGGINVLVGRTNGADGLLASVKTKKIDNKTFGLNYAVNVSATNFDLAQPFRIGSGYADIGNAQPTEILFAAIWNRELTDAEVETMYQAVKAYYARRGITI